MDFLPTRPQMTLAGAGNATSFAADVFCGRPVFEEIQSFQGVMDKIGLEVEASMQRKSCPLVSIDLIIDDRGMLGLFVFNGKLQTGNAKSAMETLLRALPEAQQQAVKDSMRPFDYLDMLRVGKMKTVAELRPYEEDDEEEEEGDYTPLEFIPHEHRKKVTRAEFLATEGEVAVPRRNLLEGLALAVTNLAETVEANPSQALRVRRALVRWIDEAQETAAVTVLSIGTSELCYQHCVHETRREALVQLGLCKTPTFIDVVKRSLDLVAIGALPCPKVSPVVKGAFFKRCSRVLQSVNPGDQKLSLRERREVAILMGYAPKCDRCPSSKAECCFEWDRSFRRWSRYEILRPFGYTATLREDELVLCHRCAWQCTYACQTCRASDKLLASGDCQCGGRAARSAPPGKPPTLLQAMSSFRAHLRHLEALDSRCIPEGAEEHAVKRRKLK